MDCEAMEPWTGHGHPHYIIITSYHQTGTGWTKSETSMELGPEDVSIREEMYGVPNLTLPHQIASRYITDPVLFQRPAVGLVKFDIRYMILLKSVDPVEAYVYTVFWLRFANK